MYRLIVSVLLVACGTTNVKLEPVKVEPIHMTIDVNLHHPPDVGPQPPR
jgi:hypothetical protein